MKFPEFPKLLNGPSAMGEGDARSIHYTGAPFLTIQGPTTRAQKKGDQVQVSVDDEKLKYWFTLAFRSPSGEGAIYTTNNLELTKMSLRYAGQSQKYSYGEFGVDGALGRLYAGDGYVVRTWASTYEPDDTNGTYWPTIQRVVGSGVEELPSVTAGQHKATTFLETAKLGGMTRDNLSGSCFVTGAVGAKAQGWGCGFAGLQRLNDDPTSPRYPFLWTMNTTTKAIQQRGVKAVNERDHLPYTVFNAGRGKATYMHGVREELIDYEDEPDPDDHRTWKEQHKLWISTSSNHGASFSTNDATFLDDLIYKKTRFSSGESTGLDFYYDREWYVNAQLEMMTRKATFIYVGNGNCLLYIPNAYLEGRDDPSDGDPEPAKFQPAIFIGNGSSYSRLNWPADDWHVDVNGQPLPGITNIVGFSKQDSMRSLCWSFGTGCAFVPVKTSGAWQWLVTYNSGSSWEFKPVPSFLYSAFDGGHFGATEKPYGEGQDGKGSLIFVSRVPETREVRFYRTNGLFDEWKQIAKARLPSWAGTFPASLNVEAEDILNFGDRPDAKSNVFPAFPGEFEPDDV